MIKIRSAQCPCVHIEVGFNQAAIEGQQYSKVYLIILKQGQNLSRSEKEKQRLSTFISIFPEQ